MTADNVFELIKADKYSQEGRDKIGSIMSKEVEDKVYNIGDISQKTGLIKTANGWVEPPKNRVNPARQGHLESESAPNLTITKEDEERFGKAALSGLSGPRETSIGKGKTPEFGKGSGTESDPDKKGSIAWYANQAKGKSNGSSGAESKSAEKMPDNLRKGYEDHAKKISTESLESLIRNKDKAYVKHNDEIADIYKKELESRKSESKAKFDEYGQPSMEAKDAAPRCLTGDCKIRIRK